MTRLTIATLVGFCCLFCFLAGCSAPRTPDPAETQKKVNREKFRKAKLCYAAFLDEAVHAADLLASQPEAGQLEAEIRRLNTLLSEATDVYPENATLDETGRQCKGIIRFFTASLATIKRNFTGKGEVSEKTKRGVYAACASNESVARQSVEVVRAKLGLTPKSNDEN